MVKVEEVAWSEENLTNLGHATYNALLGRVELAEEYLDKLLSQSDSAAIMEIAYKNHVHDLLEEADELACTIGFNVAKVKYKPASIAVPKEGNECLEMVEAIDKRINDMRHARNEAKAKYGIQIETPEREISKIAFKTYRNAAAFLDGVSGLCKEKGFGESAERFDKAATKYSWEANVVNLVL